METKEIVLELAEKEMAFRLLFAGTEVPFLYYGARRAEKSYDRYVETEKKSVLEYQKRNKCTESYAEFSTLQVKAGDALLRDERMLFHGVGMIYKERGYILTAPSGTGKSTQFRNLHTLYGNECRIINGDKPVVRHLDKNMYMIYPSPWNGKENWAGKESALLRAVIWLEQGPENQIRECTAPEMVLPIFNEVIYSAPDSETVHEACVMIDGILSSVPVYRFVNTGELSSSKMLGDFLDREAEK